MLRYKKIPANSHLISFGNTGARLSDPRATYVKILNALIDFRRQNEKWDNEAQVEFGKLIGTKGIFDIKTDNVISSDKDVRLKTGFISQLGFTTENRIITEVGIELLKYSSSIENNEFDITKDSFVYLKQFLKYQQADFELLPLLSLIYAVIEFDNELPIDFVAYIWSGSQTKKELIQNIRDYKKHFDYKSTLYKSILYSENTAIAEKNISAFFANSSISKQKEFRKLLYAILPHGKGNTFKDKTISLFNDFYFYWQNKDKWNKEVKKKFIQDKLKTRYKDIASKKSSDYLEAMFGTTLLNNSSDWDKIICFFESTSLIKSADNEKFVLNSHVLYMFIKKLSVCEEYRDLNIRHLKLIDIFVFEHDKIKLDIVFWYLFKSVKRELLTVKPLDSTAYISKLETSQKELGDIYSFLKISVSELTKQIASDFPEVKKIGLQNFALKKREERLVQLVNTVFTVPNIVRIFELIYPRNDKKVRDLIKEWYQEYEATIPALFEYLLGISFYWLTQQRVKLSDIIQSNLDVNLLPKTHTAGGQADIIVQYNAKDYLIEATLSENDGQRKMEAEPVPRHLAKHILEVNPNSLALFVAGQLDPNNLVVLRNYKFSTWYNSDGNSVDEMNILPLSISNMIYLLKQKNSFEDIERKFVELLNSENRDGFMWYSNEVNMAFSNGN